MKITKVCYLCSKKSIHSSFCYGLLFHSCNQNLVQCCPRGFANLSKKPTKQHFILQLNKKWTNRQLFPRQNNRQGNPQNADAFVTQILLLELHDIFGCHLDKVVQYLCEVSVHYPIVVGLSDAHYSGWRAKKPLSR